MTNHKALALFSGGLDSILAVKVILEAGVAVEALHFINPFHQHPEKHLQQLKNSIDILGVKIHFVNLTEDYLQIIKHPKYGYGKHFNPCLDCRIYQIKLAKEKMQEIDASFLISGEVIDQRPNSQRRDAMDIVERDSEIRGYLLRPLCAKHLRPTIPEIEGWVDRKKLLDIKGRGRTRQIELAAKFGITEYPAPAGGCLLTYKEYGLKIKDLIQSPSEVSLRTVDLLRLGRHLRLSSEIKLIVGKDHSENEYITKIAEKDDYLLNVKSYEGPTTLYCGSYSDEAIRLAAAITAGYSRAPLENATTVIVENGSNIQEIQVNPLTRAEIHHYYITK